jgi:dipeptidyl aminopeptidase/acylaminoacyl peptidase
VSRDLRLDDLYALQIPEQPALSPDGSHIAYVLTTADRAADRNQRAIWLVAADGQAARKLTDGPADTNPTWSSDGRLAFLRIVDDVPQLFQLCVDTGDVQQLTSMPWGVGIPEFSPDGHRIALTAGVPVAQDDARDAAAELPMATDRLDYQSDGEPWRRGIRRHIHLLDLGDPSGGAIRQLTRGDWDASTPSWSPDGTRLAFTADMDFDSDLTRTRAVYTISADGQDETPQLVGPSTGHLGSVQWIGERALLAGGRTDTRTGHDSLWRIEIATGRLVDLTAGLDRSIMRGAVGYPGARPHPIDGGRTILFCARDRGCTQLFAVPVTGGSARLILGGDGRVVTGMSTVGSTIAVALTTSRSFGEIVVTDTDGGDQRVCTSHGRTIANIRVRERVEREFRISDGTRVHGWLLRDPAAPTPAPLLLDIHGGPHNAWNGSADPVHLYHQLLVARGWTVLLVNPRGSDGYGEQFYTQNVGAWGRGDAADFTEPVDQLIAEGIADPARLAVTGYSYGGFMTCYLTAHDNRFAAAVTGGPVTDLISDSGTCDEAQYMADAEMGAQSWSDPALYWELSPIRAVKGVSTPTLILQGNDDLRCPRGQAQQWFAALRQRRVPTRLVLYPGASHLFPYQGRPSHRIDYNRRLIDWLEAFTPRKDAH